jgi:hypothetical protein
MTDRVRDDDHQAHSSSSPAIRQKNQARNLRA